MRAHPNWFNLAKQEIISTLQLSKTTERKMRTAITLMGTNPAKATEGGDVLLDINFSDAFVKVDEETGQR